MSTPAAHDRSSSEAVLRDGSTVVVRDVGASDAAMLEQFLRELSEVDVAERFGSPAIDLKAEALRAAGADGRLSVGLIALAGVKQRLVAHASYVITGPGEAEISFETVESDRGRGLATVLLRLLAERARANDVRRFVAFIRSSNRRMAELLVESGFTASVAHDPSLDRWTVSLEMTPSSLQRFDDRDRASAAAAVRPVLEPRTIAVVGASRSRGTIGAEIFHNLLAAGFKGTVYPVNRRADVVQSVAAHRSVGAIPTAVDLAVIAVPAEEVLGVARDCAAKGVRGLVVISAGFAEAGERGIARQAELLAVCRSAGMRLVGPNCMGVLNTASAVSMNATFAPTFPPEGPVAFLSQSGALGLAIIDEAAERGIGLSSFASIGNRADLSGNDLLAYWGDDQRTKVILLYLESLGNPRHFARLARHVGRAKPIVAVKSGRSVAGARATSSHTGALVAGSDAASDALFRQCGVVRAQTLGELFDVATLLANQPFPAGDGVGIISNAGGPAILAADACEAAGLRVVPLPPLVRESLAAFLPEEAATANPVDLVASASAEQYERAIGVLGGEASLDALIVLFTPPLVTRTADVAEAIRRAAARLPRAIPILTVFLSARGVPAELKDERVRVPSFVYPEDAARALAHAVHYARWRALPAGDIPRPTGLRSDEAREVIAAALDRGDTWLSPEDVARLFACYGLPLIEGRVVADPSEAERAAAELGGTVALKIVAPALQHKSDIGGVRLGLAAAEVGEAATELRRAAAARGLETVRLLVQPMAARGVELIAGLVRDPVFGPVVACGAGGTAVELLGDVAVSVAPLTDRDATAMLRSLRTFPLLDGFRGAARCRLDAVEDVLLRLSTMADEHDELAELDANPLVASPEGAVILDARVRVERGPTN